jgi:HNH endonuclease
MQRKKIPGYPRHSLTPEGELFTDGEPAEVFVGRDGYWQAYLHKGKKKTRHPKKIYKLMALTYLKPRPSPNHLVRHLDGDSLNDAAANLAWGTHSDNMEDLRKHREDRAPLTKALKSEIIRSLGKRNRSVEFRQELAKKNNVAFSTVNRIYWTIKDKR